MTVTVLRRISGLEPLPITTSNAPTHGPTTDVYVVDRRLVQGPRPVTNGDMGRDCCRTPQPAVVDGRMRCGSCRQGLVAAWHGEGGRLHSSVDGANDPLEFP